MTNDICVHRLFGGGHTKATNEIASAEAEIEIKSVDYSTGNGSQACDRFLCLEGFLYSKICVLCALTSSCTLAKEVQLFPGLGVYSRLFAICLQCLSKDSRTPSTGIGFYYALSGSLRLLYVLSTTVVSDLVYFIIQVSNNSIRKNIIFICYAGISKNL